MGSNRTAFDWSGRVVGGVRVLRRANGEANTPLWHCICVCGKKRIIRSQSLTSREGSTRIRGVPKSCGCYTDWTGKTVGRLKVLERSGKTKSANPLWKCKCSCGNTCLVASSSLKMGAKQAKSSGLGTRSCGCLKKDRVQTYPYLGKKRQLKEIAHMQGITIEALYNRISRWGLKDALFGARRK